MGKSFDGDFNGPIGAAEIGGEEPPYQLAARAMASDDLASLFISLAEANKLWATNARTSALASLYAVSAFLQKTGYNQNGLFSRPLDILSAELNRAPAAAPGNVLPVAAGRKRTTNRKHAERFIIAAAAFAVDELTKGGAVPMGPALKTVAAILHTHSFPAPTSDLRTLITKLAAWRVNCKKERIKAAGYYKTLLASPPAQIKSAAGDLSLITRWLVGELEHAGYTSSVNY